MRLIIPYILFVFIFCSCHESKTGERQVFSVDTRGKSDKNFDDFFRLKEVIKLETNDSVLVGDILKVIMVEDRIFVLPWSCQAVFAFDRKGKYLNKVERVGRGAAEYLKIADFVVTAEPRQIIVYAPEGRLNYYNWEGVFIHTEKWPSMLSNMELLPDGKWLENHAYAQLKRVRDSLFVYRVALSSDSCVKTLAPAPLVRTIMPWKMVTSMYVDRGRYYVAPITENTIYEYNPEKMDFISRYVFEVLSYPLPDIGKVTLDDFSRRFMLDYFVLFGEYVGENVLMVNAFLGREGKLLHWIANKAEGNVEVVEWLEDKENELPLNRNMQHSGFDGNMLVFATPMSVKQMKFKNASSVGNRLAGELAEEDNPVLLVYEEK